MTPPFANAKDGPPQPSTTPGRTYGFMPFWLMDRHLHWKASQKMIDDRMGGPAFGRLDFSGTENLPHRRLLTPKIVQAAAL